MSAHCSCNRLRDAEDKAAKWDALVRCADCIHWEGGDCTFEQYGANPDGFCHLGTKEE